MQCTIGGGGFEPWLRGFFFLGVYKRRNGKEMKDVL